MLFFFFFSSFQCFNLFSCIPLFFFLVCMCVCQELSQESLSIEKEREGNWGEELLVAVFFFFASGWLGRCDAELTWHFAFYCCSLLYLFFFFFVFFCFFLNLSLDYCCWLLLKLLSLLLLLLLSLLLLLLLLRGHTSMSDACQPLLSRVLPDTEQLRFPPLVLCFLPSRSGFLPFFFFLTFNLKRLIQCKRRNRVLRI